MTDVDDIVTRLRAADCKLSGRKLEDAADALCRDAADTIDSLRASKAKLRIALTSARNAIASLREYDLGYINHYNYDTGEVEGQHDVRAELLNEIDAALAPAPAVPPTSTDRDSSAGEEQQP